MNKRSPFDDLSTVLYALGIAAIMAVAVGMANAHSGKGNFDPFVSVDAGGPSFWEAAPDVRVNQLPQL